MDMCAFTHEQSRTRRYTIHPCTLTTTLTKKHHKSLHFRTHLDQSHLLSRISGCALLNHCWSTKEWVVAALGRRWTWRLWRATVGGCHRQRPWVAKQQFSCCGNQARRPVAALCRWEPTAFDARALGRDPRVHRGRWGSTMSPQFGLQADVW